MDLKITARCVVAFLKDERGCLELTTGDKKSLGLGDVTQNLRGGDNDLPELDSIIAKGQLPQKLKGEIQNDGKYIDTNEDRKIEDIEEVLDDGDDLIVGSQSNTNNEKRNNNYHER